MSNNENASVSQSVKLVEFFKTGQKITSVQASSQLGIIRLSARVSELVNIGFPISREAVLMKNQQGKDVLIKQYWIEPYRKAKEFQDIINRQPRCPLFDPKAYFKAQRAKKELDELKKNNRFLFGDSI